MAGAGVEGRRARVSRAGADGAGASEHAPLLALRDALGRWEKPALVLFSDSDPIFSPRVAEKIAAHIPGALEPEIVAGAGHFLQEDKGEEIGARIARFVASSR